METLAFKELLKYIGGVAGLIVITLISTTIWLKFKMNKICEDITELEKKVTDDLDWSKTEFKEYTRTTEVDLKFKAIEDVVTAKLETLLSEIRSIKSKVNGSG